MKAIICRGFGAISELDYADMPDPVAADDGVVVRAAAIGVNFPDGLLVQGLYQLQPGFPFVPGMEMAGVVESVGASVTGFRPGDRVVALGTLGGYAEKMAAPAGSVIALPDSMPYADACALLCAWGTAHHALRQRARLEPGETLVVLGAAGSTGIAAIQIGKAMGARVVAVASSEDKRQACLKAGADAVLPYDDLRDAIRQATGGKGADVVFDPVGGSAFDAASRAMARNGRLLVIGFASGEIPKFPVNLALLKEYAVVGVFWGGFTRAEPEVFADNMAELFAWHGQGRIRPLIDGEYRLADAASVLDRVLGRGAIGKPILLP
ncbi:NADPH:quinone reductase-like Zn-dependent oxidoreductase [Hoeflea marina]|uniref:NADPH:quinone reductase-like Zn-dependent oxidoreductase n=1 Tax=Hoeflea marina TaxID=274592 RepID=A0A317PSP5_9HYPH|nr:NADPH:quinone oxidoreductase family protein [Hoeflea marina]PWW03927.1 NADPH:quinone reductase-like Zn-dependent oxidoreductase [Hoeflea marina]